MKVCYKKRENMVMNQYICLEVIHKFIKYFHKNISKNEQFPNYHNLNTESEIQKRISELVLSNKSLFIGRFGATELFSFINYLQVSGKLLDSRKYSTISYLFDECYPKWFSLATKNNMCNLSGFFPIDDESFIKWGRLVEEDIKDLDCVLTWQKNEEYIKSYLIGKERILNSEIYNPFYYKNPWSKSLEGKKVLVISPFTESIKKQYERRELLFKDSNVLPEFELKTIKAYNVLRGINPYKEINSWFDALELMEKQIDLIDYDIALLGCGAYAFNLGAYIKRQGKTAITLCGSLQTLFGIYGNRYEEAFKESGLLNEYWIRPAENEKPAGFEKVENGCYW